MGKTRLSLSAQQQGDLFIKSSGNPVHNISIPLELIFATLRRLKDADKGRKKESRHANWALSLSLSLSLLLDDNDFKYDFSGGEKLRRVNGSGFFVAFRPPLQNGGGHAQIGKKGLRERGREGGAIMNLKP